MSNKCAITCVVVRAPMQPHNKRVGRDNGLSGACAPDKHTLLRAATPAVQDACVHWCLFYLFLEKLIKLFDYPEQYTKVLDLVIKYIMGIFCKLPTFKRSIWNIISG